MSNAVFGYPIYSDPTATFVPTFSGGSWSGTLPLTNLADRRLAKVARSSSAALADTRFAVDLKAARRVGVIAIPKSTLSTAAKVRVLGATEMLFDYEAGDDVVAKGGTFTRASTATYIDAAGVVRTAASGVIRDSHFIGGVRHTLLEGLRENLLLRSQEFDNAAWGKTNVTLTANAATAPDGTLTADKAAATATAATLLTQAVVIAATSATLSCFAKRGSGDTDCRSFNLYNVSTALDIAAATMNYGTGVLTVSQGTGTITALANGWYRITLTAAAGITSGNTVRGYTGFGSGVETAGAFAYLWGAQLEAGAFASSYIPTVAATVTRAADALYFSVPSLTPQAMSVYLDLVSSGNGLGTPYFAIVGSSSGDPAIQMPHDGVNSYGRWQNGALFDSIIGAAILAGTHFEQCFTLSATGVGLNSIALNGGAISTAGPSAAGGIPATFGATPRVTLGFVAPGNEPFAAFRSVRVMAGAQTMAAMRATVYDSGWLDAWPVVYPAGSLPSDDARLVTGTYTAEEAALLGSIPFTHVPATAFTARYWSVQISDAANAAGYVDLARLVLAGSYQPSINMSYGHRLALTSATIRTETDGGAAIYNDKPRRREQHFTIDQLPDDEALVSVYDMLLRIGTSGQLYFVFDAADTAHMHRRAMLCVLKELSALEFPYHRRYAIPFALIEEL